MTAHQDAAHELRTSDVATAIRRERLVVVLRRVAPRSRLVALVEELVAAGVRIFEVTFDTDAAADDLVACRDALTGLPSGPVLLGAGTVRTPAALDAAIAARADFAMSPLFDPPIIAAALRRGLPFVPGALSPTEVDAAWRAGATFVKLFPASSVGPGHVRELRGPMGEIELIPTGGIDATGARAFLAAGAVAVGMGGAIVNASPADRAALVAATRPSG